MLSPRLILPVSVPRVVHVGSVGFMVILMQSP